MPDTLRKKIVTLVSIFALLYTLFSVFMPGGESTQHIKRSYFRADFKTNVTDESVTENNITSQLLPKYITELYKGD